MMKKRLLLCLLLCAVFLLPACGGKQKAPQVEVYVQEHWAQYAPFAYENGVLTLTMRSTMRYDSACKLGGSAMRASFRRKAIWTLCASSRWKLQAPASCRSLPSRCNVSARTSR